MPSVSAPGMEYMTVDEKGQCYIVQCADFQPVKQRFNWKKLGKEEALVLAKKARDLQVLKRKNNAQLEKERELAEEAAEEAWRIERNKAVDELEAKQEEQHSIERAQKAQEEREKQRQSNPTFDDEISATVGRFKRLDEMKPEERPFFGKTREEIIEMMWPTKKA